MSSKKEMERGGRKKDGREGRVEGKGERTGRKRGEGESGTMLKEVQGSQGSL